MPRQIMFDNRSAGQSREMFNTELRSKEIWYKNNKECIWKNNLGPIQGRIMAICHDKCELARELMDSQDEYFKYCRAPEPNCCNGDNMTIQIGPDPCDECCRDPTIPMRTPHPYQRALLFEGISHEGGGAYGYLHSRYNMGLPEFRYCSPPTTNSEYAWRLKETICKSKASTLPRKSTIGPQFYRARGVLCEADYAPFHFPC